MEAWAGLVPLKELGEAVGLAVWEGLDERCIDEGEDGDGGSDAKGEGEDGGGGEARVAAELADGEAEILEDGLDAEADDLIALFDVTGGVAEANASGAPGGCGAEAVALKIVSGGGAMEGHLLFKFALELFATEQDLQLLPDARAHDASEGSCRIRPMAAIICSNWEISLQSCFRPTAVMV